MLTLIIAIAMNVASSDAFPNTCKFGVDPNIVENHIVYSCHDTSGQSIYLPIACQVPNGNPSILYPYINGGVGNDGIFKYRCIRTAATAVKLDTIGCLTSSGADAPINQPYETEYNGVITCSRDASGKVTRSVRHVCVRPNRAYYEVGENWTEANGKFKCSFDNGEYHVVANGCITGSVVADLDQFAKIGDKLYKCLKDVLDEREARFEAVEEGEYTRLFKDNGLNDGKSLAGTGVGGKRKLLFYLLHILIYS